MPSVISCSCLLTKLKINNPSIIIYKQFAFCEYNLSILDVVDGGIDVYFSSLNSDSKIRVWYRQRSHEIEIESEIYCVASFYNQIQNIFATELVFSSLFTKNENEHQSKGKQSKTEIFERCVFMFASINSAMAWYVNISGECGGPTADDIQCACLLPITVTRRPLCVYIRKLIVVFYSAQMTLTKNDAPLSASEFVVEKEEEEEINTIWKTICFHNKRPYMAFRVQMRYSIFKLCFFHKFLLLFHFLGVNWLMRLLFMDHFMPKYIPN